MCGILGILGEQVKSINVMLPHIRDRGPDNYGIYESANCSLAMTRLAIVDIDGGIQPMMSLDRRYVIVFNGELYNHSYLREMLIARGYRFNTKSDTEVLLNMYIEFKNDMFSYLSGMYAFSIYDNKLNTAIISRDHLGIKPLYYTLTKDNLFFSSNLKSLKEVVDVEINLDAINFFIGSGFIPGNSTPFNGIYKVPPRSFITIDSGLKIIINKYNLAESTNQQLKESLIKSFSEELSDNSIKKCLLLSGGIDSSLIGVLAKKEIGVNLHALIAKFDNGNDETSNAISLAQHFGIEYTIVEISVRDAIEALNAIMSKIDEPIIDTAIIPTYILSKKAQDMGYKVIISGAGSDELFGGYHRQYWNYRKLINYFPAISLKIIKLIPERLNYLKHILIMTNNEFIEFSQSISGINFSFLINILSVLKLKKILFSTSEYYKSSYKKFYKSETRNLMRLDEKTYLVDNILALTDKITMMNSIECRVPFCNVNILNSLENYFSKNIIPTKYSNAKYMLVDILSNYFKRTKSCSKKLGFNGPIEHWVMSTKFPLIKDINIKSNTLSKIINQKSLIKLWNCDKYKKKYAESFYMIWFLDNWLSLNE